MPTIVDFSYFPAFCRQIASQPTVGLKAWDVMLYEVGRVLEQCVRLTTRENVEKIKRSIEFKNRTLPDGKNSSGPPIIYVTKRGLVWFAEEPGPGNAGKAKGPRSIQALYSSGKTFHPMTEFFRYGNPRWARYQAFLAQLKDRQINVREVIGRAGQSWVQIADALGIRIEAPAYVRNAPAFRGRKHINGTSQKYRTINHVALVMKNVAPILLGTMDGNRILQTSINGRRKYFETSLRKGVFDDVKSVARQYPGLRAA
ncbi:MAG TPA: hypothetical protein VF089_17905 [Candidatus Binatia bacterium]